MIRNIIYIFLIFMCINFISTLNLPSYLTKCKKNDPALNDCIFENIKKGWPIFAQGNRTYRVPVLSPLQIPSVFVKVDDNLYGTLINGQVSHLDTLQLQSVDFDMEKNHMEVKYLIEKILVNGTYDIKGHLFSLPISGKGIIDVSFYGGIYRYTIDLEVNEKNGKHYYKIIKSLISYDDIKKVECHINFFNSPIGKILSDVLNENWRDVSSDITTSVGLAFAEVFSSAINGFFSKVPIENMFDD